MRNAPEVVREVGVNDFRVAAKQQCFHLDHRLLRISPRTVGILLGWKIGFEDRFQHQHCCCHADPIAQGRDAQRPEFAIGFRYKHSSDAVRSVSLLPERKRQFTKPPLHPIRFDVFSQGVSGYEPVRCDRRERLDALQTGDGRPLPLHLKAQVRRELDRLELLLAQIKAVEAERDALLAVEQTKAPVAPAMLLGVKGIGPEFAAVLWSEGLSRPFENRRQIAAYAGLAPTPWQSGSVDREQGISQSGNPRLRTTMIQLAWLWLRHQPDSALALWFHDRVKRNGGRLRKTTIVALARKLLVALWKYVTAGVVIEGAAMKTA